MKKNILVLNQSKIIGGAELALKNFIDADDKFIFFILTDPKIANLYHGINNTSTIYTSGYFKKYPFKKILDLVSVFPFIYSIIRNLILISRIVRTNQIHLIYGNNSYDCILVSLYRFINPGIKTVQHIHDTLPKKSFLAEWIKLFIKKYDHIIVPSTHTDSHLKSIFGNNRPVSVVHNGIDFNEIKTIQKESKLLNNLKLDKNRIIIATICRIDKNKRVDIFIESLCKLQQFRNDFTGIVVGESDDDELLKSLKMKIKSARVPVYFTGSVPYENILNLYNNIDLLMINSDTETFSLVTIEAMSNNCIVLARKVGGINDIIQDNVNGYFYDYNAGTDTIAKKINTLLQMSSAEKKKIKKNALEHVKQNFQHKQKVEKINEIFYELLNNI